MKTDIRRYLATDVAARRLKLNTETGTAQSSVQTNNQQDPFRKIWRHQTVLKKNIRRRLTTNSETNQLELTTELSQTDTSRTLIR